MFYLFLLTGIVVNTIYTLSMNEMVLSWMLLLCGFIISSYLNIIREVEQIHAKMQTDYSQKMQEARDQLMTAQTQKVKQITDTAAKTKAGR